MKKKVIIGRHELISFPLLELYSIEAKIDTGAYTSAIYCSELLPDEHGIYCKFLNAEHPQYNNNFLFFEHYELSKIRSSNGQIQQRYIVSTSIIIGKQELEIELSLSDRNEMKFPVLLGRKFLKGNFMVDVTKTNILSK